MTLPPHGFSTLGCPDWPFERVLDFAVMQAVDVLEIRFLNGRPVGIDTTQAEISDAARRLAGAPVAAHTLATGVHIAKGPAVTDELLCMLDIAAAWGCRQLRVFAGGTVPSPDLTVMAAAVSPALDRAMALGLAIGIETHDHLRAGRDAARLAAFLDHPSFGIIWDTVHSAGAGETPSGTWAAAGPYVIELQVKDGLLGSGTTPTLLDRGEVDWRGALAAALRGGFKGPFVLEWEKAWHRDLADPELAIPYELAALRDALATLA